jgi:hypothetical protein
MDRDWEPVMRRVYDFLGLEMESALPGMQDYIARSRALKRKPHRYSLAEFGLSEGEVLERLSDYIERFEIAIEPDLTRQDRRVRATA